ncbi:ORF54 [Ranid herpesvirus 2]|uniref:ORF54 n=1 Tax=Ranid herpesvirus 2 TaxID=389214 RepID=Q14W52_9VIRU|nr:ORF54 [Ranid herpesvirus 2]ABG25618.1 ORF54 [Ranid herpesvirus 2]
MCAKQIAMFYEDVEWWPGMRMDEERAVGVQHHVSYLFQKVQQYLDFNTVVKYENDRVTRVENRRGLENFSGLGWQPEPKREEERLLNEVLETVEYTAFQERDSDTFFDLLSKSRRAYSKLFFMETVFAAQPDIWLSILADVRAEFPRFPVAYKQDEVVLRREKASTPKNRFALERTLEELKPELPEQYADLFADSICAPSPAIQMLTNFKKEYVCYPNADLVLLYVLFVKGVFNPIIYKGLSDDFEKEQRQLREGPVDRIEKIRYYLLKNRLRYNSHVVLCTYMAGELSNLFKKLAGKELTIYNVANQVLPGFHLDATQSPRQAFESGLPHLYSDLTVAYGRELTAADGKYQVPQQHEEGDMDIYCAPQENVTQKVCARRPRCNVPFIHAFAC